MLGSIAASLDLHARELSADALTRGRDATALIAAQPRWRWMSFLFVLLLTGVSLLTSGCSDMNPSVGPDQATIALQANPATIPAKTGISEIVAIGTKKTGAPIWDDVVISFSADVGRVEPQSARFRDGRAYARYFAPLASGDATITALSGGVEATLTITVAEEPPVSTLLLSANRTSLPSHGGQVKLRVVAYDEKNNPVAGAPVVFAAAGGRLASGGQQIRTNSKGLARDTLSTDVDSVVTARSGSIVSEPLDIDVEDIPDNEPPTADFVFSPTGPLVDAAVYFNGEKSSDPDGRIVSYRWDFGDSKMGSGRRVSHIYATAATYTVVLCVTDNRGARVCTSQTVTVTEPPEERR